MPDHRLNPNLPWIAFAEANENLPLRFVEATALASLIKNAMPCELVSLSSLEAHPHAGFLANLRDVRMQTDLVLAASAAWGHHLQLLGLSELRTRCQALQVGNLGDSAKARGNFSITLGKFLSTCEQAEAYRSSNRRPRRFFSIWTSRRVGEKLRQEPFHVPWWITQTSSFAPFGCMATGRLQVIEVLSSIQRHEVRVGEGPAQVMVTQLTKTQREIIRLLGLDSKSYGLA